VVGIVIVSHSFRIAEGVAELAREMGGPDVRLETAGGLDMPEHPIGTDAALVMAAIDRAWSEDGVLVLMDLGSAVLSAEMALEFLDEDRRGKILLCEAPLVEGAVSAAVTAKIGASLQAVAAEARGGLAGKIAHLEIEPDRAAEGGGGGEEGDAGEEVAARLKVRNPHGLHARPAARFVQTASGFDARVSVLDLTNGRGPADAASLNGVATLGVMRDHEIEVRASGPMAAEAIEALRALADRDFDEGPEAEVEAAPSVPDAAGPQEPTEPGTVRGFAASPGIALGAARRFHVEEPEIPDVAASDPAVELAALERAIGETAVDIRAQRDQVAARAGEAQAAIFDAHLLFLRDEALLAPARRSIHAYKRTAAQAWAASVHETAAAWDGLDDEYLRARAADLRSVGAQVLAHVLGLPVPRPHLEAPGILVAEDLTPADTAGLDTESALGIATARGGPTSHAAVLARAMGIPAVVALGDALGEVREGTAVALDGDRGLLLIEPAEAERAALEEIRDRRAAEVARARAVAAGPAVTVDGATIEVAANIGTPAEAVGAVAAGADGVGLFRTEFLFMGRDAMPTEDEQTAAYVAAAEALSGRPLLIRTLDAGADKPIPYLGQDPEANPFLGVRGLRLGLARPELLAAQLRAVVRVAEAGHRVRVMFPMVATLEELLAGGAALEEARAARGPAARLEVGIMIEVPAAALNAAALAEHVDFFSIGTNDLTQYTAAADRGNEHVAALNDPLHPAVLRLIRATVQGAEIHGRWVGVCGELAADPGVAALLIGLGVTELSMAAPAVAEVKEAVRRTETGAARQLAERALACGSTQEVRALLPGT
jgi:multiphosphoryl transfer protein